MSNITIFYNKLIEIVGTDLFSTKIRIPNPYDPSKNSGPQLRDSWGVKLNPSTLGTIGIYHQHNESREFSIVFSSQVFKLKSNPTAMDTAIKALAEANNTLMVRLLNNDQLGIPDSVGIIEFVGNSGIEFLEDDKTDYILTETTFAVDIMEDI